MTKMIPAVLFALLMVRIEKTHNLLHTIVCGSNVYHEQIRMYRALDIVSRRSRPPCIVIFVRFWYYHRIKSFLVLTP